MPQPTGRRPRAVIAAATVAVVAAGAVASWHPWTDSSAWVTVQSGAAPTVLTMGPPRGDAAYLAMAYAPARLSYFAEEDCFVITDPDVPAGGEKAWGFVVWPDGTVGVRDGDQVGVKIPGSEVAWVGDRVRGGGGPIPESSIKTFFPQVPEKCTRFSVDTLHEAFRLGPAR